VIEKWYVLSVNRQRLIVISSVNILTGCNVKKGEVVRVLAVKTYKENGGMVLLVDTVSNKWRQMNVTYVSDFNCETGGVIKVFSSGIFTLLIQLDKYGEVL
jgi:hypothetical protein